MLIYNLFLFLVVIGILIIIHEFGHFIIAKRSGVKVEIFSVGFGPSLFKKKKGETEYRISLIPLGGYVKLAGEIADEENTGAPWEFMSKPIWKRFLILVAGPLFNYLLALILFILLFVIGMPRLNTQIGEVLDNYPAQQAGLEKADRVLAVNGREVSYWQDMVELIRVSKKDIIDIEVYRSGEGQLNFKLIPKIDEKENIYGQKQKIPVIGIYPSGETIDVKYTFLNSIIEGTKHTAYLTYVTCKGLWNIIIGNISFKEAATGPLGIYRITTEAAKEGIRYLLNIVAVISMSLGIINLFPFPVLDGGHLLFLLIEKIKGSPLKPKVQQITMQIGMYILIVLMAYLVWIDYLKFFKR